MCFSGRPPQYPSGTDEVDVSAALFSVESLARLRVEAVDSALPWLKAAIVDGPEHAPIGPSLGRRELFSCMVEHSLPIPVGLLGIRSLLLIDDEPQVLRSMVRVLRQAVPDLILHLAEGPREGLNKVDELDPDAVLVDAYMPVTGGVELCSLIGARSVARQVPVLAMTADPSPELALAFARAGAIAFLEKPVDAPALFEALSGHLVPSPAGDW